MKILSIGEILWDVLPDGEYLGGAPLNFAAHATRLGHEALFVSAVGKDTRGHAALQRIAGLGLSTRFVAVCPQVATGYVSVALQADGQPQFTIHRPAAYDFPALDAGGEAELARFQPGWLYFGTLAQTSSTTHALTTHLMAAHPRARRFYDVNLRIDSWTPELVLDLLRQANVVKLNDGEAAVLGEVLQMSWRTLEEFCRKATARFGWEGICVTRGAEGCSILLRGEYVETPGYPVDVADAVGAGDAFAAAFLHGLGHGWAPAAIGDFANRVGALIASRSGAIPPWTLEECHALTREPAHTSGTESLA